MRRVFITLILTIVGCFAAFAQAEEERIISFKSLIRVHTDASITVNEEITVYVSGDRIKRGIFRSLPLSYTDYGGISRKARYEILDVSRGGKPEPYHVAYEGDMKVIYVGEEDVFLDPGIYTYNISYRSPMQVRFFDDSDELYWNVTGNYWDFKIEYAEATIRMPYQVEILSSASYTGPLGSKASDSRFHKESNGDLVFHTSQPLGPKEGLSFAFSFAKNIIKEPTATERFWIFVYDNVALLIGLILIFAALIYFMIAWFAVGRDPKRGAIPVLYFPPEDLSAGAMRYIYKMKSDKKGFTAAIVHMAVKKYLVIQQEGSSYTLKKTGNPDVKLTGEEQAIADKLFSFNDTIELKNTNHTTISSAIRDFYKLLKAIYQRENFFPNTRWFVPGLIISLVAAIVILISILSDGQMSGPSLFTLIFGAGTIMMVWAVFSTWRKAVNDKKQIAGAIFFSIFSVPFLIGFLVVSLVFMGDIAFIPLFMVLFIILMNIAFAYLLKAPTQKGRRLMDKIEGFREFLNTAERDELNLINAPDKTPELFERYLPFAIALGVENNWGERFNTILKQAMADNTYNPSWYHGTHFTTFTAAGFATGLGGSFSSAVSSSSVSPSSRGSGGGGFSGGGGGGGGGGGW